MKENEKDFIEPKYYVLKVMYDNRNKINNLDISTLKCKDIAILSDLTERKVRYALEDLIDMQYITKRPDSKIDYIINTEKTKRLFRKIKISKK